MKTILIIYWSQTGNTEAMAHAIAQGIEEEGNQAKLLEVSEAEPEILKKPMYLLWAVRLWEERFWKRTRWNRL